MRTEDPYQKVFDDIAKAFTKFRDMILWIAKRTMSAKDFEDFVNEFTEKADSKSEVADFIREHMANSFKPVE